MSLTTALLDPDDGTNRDPRSGLDPAAHRRYVAWLNQHGVTTVPQRHEFVALRELHDRLDERLEDAEWAVRRFAPHDPAGRTARRRRDRLEDQVHRLWLEISEYDTALASWPHRCRQPECDVVLSKEQAATASLCPRCLSGYGAPRNTAPDETP